VSRLTGFVVLVDRPRWGKLAGTYLDNLPNEVLARIDQVVDHNELRQRVKLSDGTLGPPLIIVPPRDVLRGAQVVTHAETGREITVGEERFKCPEILFRPALTSTPTTRHARHNTRW
jgi:hypothetical protein